MLGVVYRLFDHYTPSYDHSNNSKLEAHSFLKWMTFGNGMPTWVASIQCEVAIIGSFLTTKPKYLYMKVATCNQRSIFLTMQVFHGCILPRITLTNRGANVPSSCSCCEFEDVTIFHCALQCPRVVVEEAWFSIMYISLCSHGDLVRGIEILATSYYEHLL